MRIAFACARGRWPTTPGMTGMTVVLVAGLVTSGCSAGAERSPESVLAGRTVPAMLDLSGHRLPIEEYMLSDRQIDELERARITLTVSCVARFGLTLPWKVSDARSGRVAGSNSSVNLSRRYGITDPAVAARLGYRVPPDSSTSTLPPPEPELPASMELVLTGGNPGTTGTSRAVTYRGRRVPDGGCMGDAVRRLGVWSGGVGDAELADRVNQESLDRARGEPATAKAIRAWSACMRIAGHDYADPFQAPGPRLEKTGTVTREEVVVATADINCKRRTNLVGYWFTAEQAFQQLTIGDHATEFERIRRDLRTMVGRARAVLAGQAPG